jgi:hypothetical protein
MIMFIGDMFSYFDIVAPNIFYRLLSVQKTLVGISSLAFSYVFLNIKKEENKRLHWSFIILGSVLHFVLLLTSHPTLILQVNYLII